MTKTMSKTILDKESEHGFYEWLSTTNTFKNLEVGSCKDQAHDGWRAAVEFLYKKGYIISSGS